MENLAGYALEVNIGGGDALEVSVGEASMLRGADGKSAYEIAVKNGYSGTETEWIASLKGDAFQYSDFTDEQLAALKGANGITPTIGDNGNWYLGAADTGKPSRGEKGDEGQPGVYYGTTPPTGDTHPVWIDPDGGPDDGGLLPAVTADDNGKVLRVDSGAWSAQEMPDKLPNPNALTFTGAVTGSYDGSAPLSVEIPEGGSGGYNLPVASATQLGGVMPVAKTDEMTQAVGVDEAGGLWALPGGASRSWRLVGTVDFAELYSQGVTSFEYALSSPDAIYLHQENITNDHDKTDSRLQLQYDGITLGESAIQTRNKNSTRNRVNNLCWYFDGAFAKGEKSSESIGINYSFSTLNAMYALFQQYEGYPKTISGVWTNTPGSFTTIISGTLEIWARELI